jgi:hypothetical protein
MMTPGEDMKASALHKPRRPPAAGRRYLVSERLGHTGIAMTLDIYAKPRVLHLTGAKPQVAC